MKRKLTLTLVALTIGMMGATASAQYRPTPNRPNVVDKRRPMVAAPVVTAMPHTATLGKVMTIRGRWLPANAMLQLGATRIRPRFASATRLTFAIPANLVARAYQAKLIMRGYATKNLGRLTLVKPYYAPVITSVPNKVVLGKRLVIKGRHLPAAATLKIGNRRLSPVVAGPNRLAFHIPANLRPRTYAMTLLMPRGNKNLGRITLQRPYVAPVVTWSPRSATRGNTVTITGRHLAANAILKIGNVSLRATRASATRLTFKVPAYLRLGVHRVKLVTAGHAQTLPSIRVSAPQHHWGFTFSGWFGFMFG